MRGWWLWLCDEGVAIVEMGSGSRFRKIMTSSFIIVHISLVSGTTVICQIFECHVFPYMKIPNVRILLFCSICDARIAKANVAQTVEIFLERTADEPCPACRTRLFSQNAASNVSCCGAYFEKDSRKVPRLGWSRTLSAQLTYLFAHSLFLWNMKTVRNGMIYCSSQHTS